MINVDISNIWGAMSLPDLLKVEAELGQAHRNLLDAQGNYRVKLPGAQDPMTQRILETGRRIRENSRILVVLGLDSGCRCAQGLVELLQGADRNLTCREEELQILFGGKYLSSRRWNSLLRQLEGKDFSVCVAARKEPAVETAAALRSLRWVLERRYGTDDAQKRIYAVTGDSGTLRTMAREEGWLHFEMAEDLAGGFDAFSPAVLLTLAAAGLDVQAYLQGAGEMGEQCSLLSYENPLWLYTGTRKALVSRGKCIELLRYPEPDFRELAHWWRDMTARAEGCGNGLFPACGSFGMEESGLDRLVCRGEKNLFETLVCFDAPQQQVTIREDARNTDELNSLAGCGLEQLREDTCRRTVEAQSDEGVSVICIEAGALTEASLGALLWLFAMSSLLWAGSGEELSGGDAWEKHLSALKGNG